MKGWQRGSWQQGIAARRTEIHNIEDEIIIIEDGIVNIEDTDTSSESSSESGQTFILPLLKMVQFAPVNPEDIIEYEIEPDCDMYKRTLATLNSPLSSLGSPQVLSSNPEMTPPWMPPPPPSVFSRHNPIPSMQACRANKGGG